MKAYQLRPGAGFESLAVTNIATPEPRPGQVLVRTRAAALNYRDLMYARGDYINLADAPLVPLGDGAGEVIAVGAGVTRVRVGERVTHSYFPNWIDGALTPARVHDSFGTHIDGVLAESFLAHEEALVKLPSHLSWEEAATLSCAGTTAWNALFADGGLKPGATVLLLGTGGMSIWALQLAKAAGMQAIITSSNDAKLERARALGADHTINYRSNPEWQDEVLRLTGGAGVDLTVETGGEGTLPRSIKATRMGGTVSVIGGTTGFGATDINTIGVIAQATRLHGILVGSRAMLEDLCRFVEARQIRPVVDRVFDFDEAREAYAWLKAGKHFGKIVLRGPR